MKESEENNYIFKISDFRWKSLKVAIFILVSETEFCSKICKKLVITCILKTRTFGFFLEKNFDSSHCSILTFFNSFRHSKLMSRNICYCDQRENFKNYIYDQNYKNCHFYKKKFESHQKLTQNWPSSNSFFGNYQNHWILEKSDRTPNFHFPHI